MSDEPDSRGCLLVVASYTDIASTVADVVTNAAARLVMSPVLGDFIELRFADAGDRPRQEDGSPAAVARLRDELTRPMEAAAENFFGLVFVDGSAAAAERLLGDCRLDPSIARLPLRCRGLAVSEDRPRPAMDEGAAAVAQGAEVRFAPSGSWTQRTMVGELQEYAEELLNHFATTHDHGVTREELASIREPFAPSSAEERADTAEEDRPLDLSPAAFVPPGAPPAPAEQQAPSNPAGEFRYEGDARQEPQREPRRRSPFHLLPHRGKREDASAGGAPEPASGGTGSGGHTLVHLVIIDGIGARDRAGWRRGGEVLREIDGALAARPHTVYRVRAMVGDEAQAGDALRPAGELPKGSIKRPPPSFDVIAPFAQVLKMMHRDLAFLASAGGGTAMPVVVVFGLDAPLPDEETIRSYTALTEMASVIWVVPGGSDGLLSREFVEASLRILPDHEGIAKEVVSIIENSRK